MSLKEAYFILNTCSSTNGQVLSVTINNNKLTQTTGLYVADLFETI